MAKASDRARKKRRRSLIKERGLYFRALSYAFPYKLALILAVTLTASGSFLGAFSILPMVPVIQLVIDPDGLEESAGANSGGENQDFSTRQVLLEAGVPPDSPLHPQNTHSLSGSSDQWFLAKEGGEPGRVQKKGEARNASTSPVTSAPGVESLSEGILEAFPVVVKFQEYIERKKEELNTIVSQWLLAHQDSAIKIVVLLLIGAALVKALIDYQSKYLFSRVYMSATQDMKIDLYRACLDLDMGALEETTSGNLISRLSSDVSKFRSILSSSLNNALKVPFDLVAFFVVLLYLSAKVTLVTIVALPILIIPLGIVSRKLRSLTRADAEEDAYLVDVMQETLQGLQIVKAFTAEKSEQKRFSKVARAQLRRQLRRARLALAAPAIVDVLTTAAMGAVLLAGYYVVLASGEMRTSEFILYLAVLTRFYKPLKSLSAGYVRVQKALASAERIFEVIDATPRVSERTDAQPLKPLEREIRFENVSFAYSGQQDMVLNSCSFTVPKGNTIALVGLSGSGKTTVTRLVPRFFDPVEGSVLIDGVNAKDVTFKSLRDQIAIVTQETILFDTTVYENIAYGRKKALAEEIEQAARAANAHEFIMDLPEGYGTRIGERGGRLSGGQRQRIAIARAILRDAPILILDEATSALDNESEALIQEALDRLMQNRTVVVIAHRLSTVKNADRILVMENGSIVESGTHDNLLSSGGRYSDLWELALDRKSDSTAA